MKTCVPRMFSFELSAAAVVRTALCCFIDEYSRIFYVAAAIFSEDVFDHHVLDFIEERRSGDGQNREFATKTLQAFVPKGTCNPSIYVI